MVKGPHGSKKHENLANRIFHNHDVTQARGVHAAKLADSKLQHSNSTLESALYVSQAFQREVEEMNKNMTTRLEAIMQEERVQKQREE